MYIKINLYKNGKTNYFNNLSRNSKIYFSPEKKTKIWKFGVSCGSIINQNVFFNLTIFSINALTIL